jgi:hypothetical protein
MKDLVVSTMLSLRLQFFAPYVELVKKGINLVAEDVFYNYTDVTLMTRSQTRQAFKVVKEFHVITLHVLIDVCSPSNFVIVDLNCGICTCIHPFLFFFGFQVISVTFCVSNFYI